MTTVNHPKPGELILRTYVEEDGALCSSLEVFYGEIMI